MGYPDWDCYVILKAGSKETTKPGHGPVKVGDRRKMWVPGGQGIGAVEIEVEITEVLPHKGPGGVDRPQVTAKEI